MTRREGAAATPRRAPSGVRAATDPPSTTGYLLGLALGVALGGGALAAGSAAAQPESGRAADGREVGASRAAEALRRASDRRLAGQPNEAIRILRQARAASDDPRLDLALGEALAEVGELRSARGILQPLARGSHPIVSDAARAELRDVERRLPRVAVEIEGALPEGAELLVDEVRTIRLRSAGALVRVDPGVHRFVLKAEGETLGRPARVSLTEGSRERILLRVAPEAGGESSPPGVGEVSASEPAPEPEPGPPVAAELAVTTAPDGGLSASAATARDGGRDGWVPWVVGGGAILAVGAIVALVVVLATGRGATPSDAPLIVIGGGRDR
ncbi:MAG: tetratricopeptide repeat protein [Sandaracinaceae bacterium]